MCGLTTYKTLAYIQKEKCKILNFFLNFSEQIKKRIIFTRVIKSSYVGWIEIDALGTLSFWDQVKNNHGIAVDVYDENEEPLDAKEHFRLQSCNDQAGKSVDFRCYFFLLTHCIPKCHSIHIFFLINQKKKKRKLCSCYKQTNIHRKYFNSNAIKYSSIKLMSRQTISSEIHLKHFCEIRRDKNFIYD